VAPVPYAAMLALAQTGADAAAVAPSDYRLKPAPPRTRITPDPCPVARAGEIVVCARRGEGQRLRTLVPPAGVKEPTPGIGFDLGGGARVEPRVSEVAMPNGQVSKRVTVDLKIPF
jgi:hypothetical protein